MCPSPEGFLEREEGWIQGLIDWQVSGRAGGGSARGEAEEHQLWLECWFYHVQPHIQPCLSFRICKMGVTIPVPSGVGGGCGCVCLEVRTSMCMNWELPSKHRNPELESQRGGLEPPHGAA